MAIKGCPDNQVLITSEEPEPAASNERNACATSKIFVSFRYYIIIALFSLSLFTDITDCFCAVA